MQEKQRPLGRWQSERTSWFTRRSYDILLFFVCLAHWFVVCRAVASFFVAIFRRDPGCFNNKMTLKSMFGKGFEIGYLIWLSTSSMRPPIFRKYDCKQAPSNINCIIAFELFIFALVAEQLLTTLHQHRIQ